ncbi:MAG: hypothetical protein ACK5MW_02190, partial [Enterococcus sp.]
MLSIVRKITFLLDFYKKLTASLFIFDINKITISITNIGGIIQGDVLSLVYQEKRSCSYDYKKQD